MALALDELETAASRFPIEWATREHQGALERNGSLGTRGSKRNNTEQNGGNLERTQMEMLRKFQAWLEVEKFVAKAKGGVQSCSIQDMELDGRLTDVDSRIGFPWMQRAEISKNYIDLNRDLSEFIISHIVIYIYKLYIYILYHFISYQEITIMTTFLPHLYHVIHLSYICHTHLRSAEVSRPSPLGRPWMPPTTAWSSAFASCGAWARNVPRLTQSGWTQRVEGDRSWMRAGSHFFLDCGVRSSDFSMWKMWKKWISLC